MSRSLLEKLHNAVVYLCYGVRNRLYRLLSDKAYIRMVYKRKFGEYPNLENPKGFNEKLQWLNLNNRDLKLSEYVDKYTAKLRVAELIGEEYIIPTYGVWKNFKKIDFDSLPDQFVLKCNRDSGGLVICREKSKLNIRDAEKKISYHLKKNYYTTHREWVYKNIKPLVLAEKYMEDAVDERGLTDYKFYCFNGEPRFLYISSGLEDHSTASISFVDLNWEKMPFKRTDYKTHDVLPNKPKKFDEMLEICKKLSKEHAFVRVDLYEINEHVYFSEMTFLPCGGYMPFDPPEWDEKIGDLLTLPKK